MKITTIGLDIAKSIFHLFAVNKMGRFVKKRQLKRKLPLLLTPLTYVHVGKPGFVVYGETGALPDCNGSLWERQLLGQRIYSTRT